LRPTADPPYRPGMDRRRFLLTSLAVALPVPLSIEAEQAGKVWRIGVLTLAPLEAAMPLLRHFDEGIRDLGYVEGRNIIPSLHSHILRCHDHAAC
jgi:hypothetical protein